MEFVDGTWKASLSKIKYAPTNACTITDASVFPSLGTVENHELIPLVQVSTLSQYPTHNLNLP